MKNFEPETCLIDNTPGTYTYPVIIGRMADMLEDREPNNKLLPEARRLASLGDTVSYDDWDAIYAMVDDLTDHLSKYAPEGHELVWHDGSLVTPKIESEDQPCSEDDVPADFTHAGQLDQFFP